MYIPASFKQDDVSVLHELIEQHSFATLVSRHDEAPLASHMPLLLDRRSGPSGTLIGHVARANPQWRQAEGQNVLAIFSGPHAYISPAWYESAGVVPTWNYTAVHAYGRWQRVDNSALEQIVRDYVDFYERMREAPWRLDASPEFMQKLLPQIVGFRIEISRLEGKWKLSQNHPPERRQKVIDALRLRADENSLAIAALMEQSLDTK
jgi:transcriptional regulator